MDGSSMMVLCRVSKDQQWLSYRTGDTKRYNQADVQEVLWLPTKAKTLDSRDWNLLLVVKNPGF